MSKEYDVALSLKNVSKTFFIREKPSDTIRDRCRDFFRGSSGLRKIEALKNVSLDVQKGEFFGIVGHNGSGKSTLLKLIIGAIKPDKGSIIESKGKVLRLALGMGFDVHLSARHNIYVNGSVMGLTFKEIGRKFNNIVDFAGLQDYIDTPIKYYSSGMVSRLAFAISVYVDADILLIDEFFGGVGDHSFRQKSAEIFRTRIIQGKTIVFVSHEMSIVEKYCSRICVLEKGEVVGIGRPDKIIKPYIDSYNGKES